MSERDQLLAQLRDLQQRTADLGRYVDALIEEEAERRRRAAAWTPVVIKGGLAGGILAWIAAHIPSAARDHPVTAAIATLAASGAIVGVMLAPPGGDSQQATPSVPVPTAVEPPLHPTATSTRTPTGTAAEPAPPVLLPTMREASSLNEREPRAPGSTATPTGTAPTTTGTSSPTTTSTTTTGPAPQPRYDCVLRIDAVGIEVNLCVIRRADLHRATSALD